MLQVISLVPSGPALAQETDQNNPNFGKKFFLWNALPKETITSYKILKQKRSYTEAVAEEIQTPSPYRTIPKDACFLSTSPWQILSWDYELTQKRLLVAEALSQEHIFSTNPHPSTSQTTPKNSAISPLFYSCKISPVQTDHKEWQYRNKMEYSLYWDNSDQKIYLAFHLRGSHQKIPLKPATSNFFNSNQPQSQTLTPNPLSNLPQALSQPPFFQNAYSSIEHPEIAKKALKIVQELNSAGRQARDFQSLLLRCDQKGIVSGGLLENGRPHPVFPNLQDQILGQTYSYSPNGFFQINLPVYELALQEIKQEIQTDKVLDLYSGVGTIGLSVARDRELVLVESNTAAYQELNSNVQNLLKQNPKFQGHITPVFAKSEEALNYIQSDQTVILDPPRAGCDPKLITKLLKVKPEKIIYLSCNPSTQARDLRYLLSGQISPIPPQNHHSQPATTKNYQITKISPYNFFPKTPHIENLVVLEKI